MGDAATAGPAVVIEVDGGRAGLGICKDTGVEQHIRQTAALDIDVYFAGLVRHTPRRLADRPCRRRRRRLRSRDADPEQPPPDVPINRRAVDPGRSEQSFESREAPNVSAGLVTNARRGICTCDAACLS
jgi:hypothetical protein